MRFLTAAIVAGLVAAPVAQAAAPLAGPAPAVGAPADLLALDREVSALLTPGHNTVGGFCDRRLDQLLATAGRSGFDRLPPATRRLALSRIVTCDEPVLRRPEVIALIRRLEPLADDPALAAAAGAALIDADLADERPVDAARRLVRVLDNDPALVGRWWEPYLTPLIDGAMADDDLYRDIVRRLQAVPWSDQTSAAAARNNWALRRADHLVEAGDLRGAERVLARADEFDTLAAVAQERFYAPLWPRFEAAGRFDWRKVMDGELAFRRTLAEANPDSLRMQLAVMRRLRLLGRHDEAIALGEGLRKRIAAGENFADSGTFAARILAELGVALLETGRAPAAEAVFREAIGKGESGDGGVAQTLDWAGRLNGLGRHAEALALLADVRSDQVSAFGAMWLAAERVCAQAKTDPSRAWAHLATMLVNQRDAPEAMQKALLCLDRLDEAAAYYIQRVGDPARRSDALGAARTVRPPPTVGPFDAELIRRRDAVLARPDVRKAIEAVGRPIDVPLTGPLYGWF